MYEHYWRLQQPAFDNDCDARFYYAARSPHGALLKLRYCLENRKDVGVLVGDHGLGKTFVTHVLEQQLESGRCEFFRVNYPLLTTHELLRYLAQRLGGPAATVESTADGLLAHLELQLERRGENQARPVLLIDDAHLLELGQLQALQLLLNLGTHCRFGLILVGRSDLLPRLQRVPALADRVTVRVMLQPLSEDEAAPYIAHRLQVVGRTDLMWQPAAVQAAWQLARGVPRRLNQVCDLSLLVGYADGLSTLSAVEVQAAAAELSTISAD